MAHEPQRPRLAELCESFLSLAMRLEQKAAHDDAEALTGRCESLLMELESNATRAGIPLVDVDAAKYALCALLDERVFASQLPLKDAWFDQPLQVRLFGELAAGEEFYNRVDALRREPSGPRGEALEVYGICLGLGFTGKHVERRGAELRKALIEQLAVEIGKARGVVDGGLSPQANAAAERENAVAGVVIAGKRWPLWAPAAAAVAVLLLAALLCSWWLGGAIAAFDAVVRAP